MAEEEVDQNLFPSKDDLKEAEGIWAGGQEEANKPRALGNQIVDIDSATLERSGGGRLQIHYELTFRGGQFDGTQEHKYDGLGSPKQASITQQQLAKAGVDTNKANLKNLPGFLLNLAGKRMAVNCKMNDGFYNISFIKPVTESLVGAPTSRTTAGAASSGQPRKRKF